MSHYTNSRGEPLISTRANHIRLRTRGTTEVRERLDAKPWEVIIHPVIDVGFRPHPVFQDEKLHRFLDPEKGQVGFKDGDLSWPKFSRYNNEIDSEFLDVIHSIPALFAPVKYFDYKTQSVRSRRDWVCPVRLTDAERKERELSVQTLDLNTTVVMPKDSFNLKLGWRISADDHLPWPKHNPDMPLSDEGDE